MSEWVINPKKNAPPNLTMVEIKASDYMGVWYGVAMRKDYKSPPLGTSKKIAKKAFRTGWRWCYENGDRYPYQDIEAWRPLNEQD